MTIDRALWNPMIRTWPVWPCPHCGSTALSLNKETLVAVETGPSKEAHSHEAWEVSWMDERFTAQLVCGNGSCGNVVVVCGKVQNEENMFYDHEGRTQEEVIPTYAPYYFHDAPPVFPIATECPDEVAKHLRSSFALLWCDVGSAANRVRAAVEALLTERGVARRTINRHNKRKLLPLHDRIVKFKAKNAAATEALLAIKWLGNEGSHATPGGLGLEDLLDAYELFEHAIDQIYVKRDKKMLKLASGINRKRGSTRPKTKDKPLVPGF